MDNLIELSEQTVSSLFNSMGTQTLLYHNLAHTREVVEAVRRMSEHYKVPDEDHQALMIAAWWHDVGYLSGLPENHETRSAERAVVFLEKHNASEALLTKVEKCIMATRMPQKPGSLIEEIICDADLFHLGRPEFMESTKMLRKEIERISGKDLKGSEWRNSTIHFLREHHYFTDYALEKLEPVKTENLQLLVKRQEDKLNEKENKKHKKSGKTSAPEDPELKSDGILQQQPVKFDKPKRGIETMFRLMSRNHMDLSGMADSKANIMISVNSIIISVVLTVMFRRLEDMPYYIIPTLILLAVNVSTIIFAVLATRPNLTKGYFTREDILTKKANLLFFGNFHKMKLADYDWGIKQMMNDKEYLYTSITKDIYFLGVVLGKKYRLLRISYNIFMFGLVVAIIAFITAFMIEPQA
ncbi:Pycsar system effector family protein [Pollutibacter soli]|uniref:Pycsar system effector family protein n=1 Tax=Pollutibacter soli TaxID=3034157 RepID=UPI003013C5D9